MEPGKIFKKLPELKTKRLILRDMRLSDLADVFEYASNPAISKYTIWDYHKNSGQTKQFIIWRKSSQKLGKPVSWALVDRKTNKVVGTAGFETFSAAHKTAAIGYAIAVPLWGKGYMTEAVKKIISFGFNVLKLNRIEAVCDTANKGSARVMEKCGMKFEGIQRSRIISVKGRVHDVRSYAIVRRFLR